MGLHVIRCVKWMDIKNMNILTGTTVNEFFDDMSLNRMSDKEARLTLSDVTENPPEYCLDITDTTLSSDGFLLSHTLQLITSGQ